MEWGFWAILGVVIFALGCIVGGILGVIAVIQYMTSKDGFWDDLTG